MDMNSVNVIGRLTADPELRFTENSISVANLRIAVNGRNDHVDFIAHDVFKHHEVHKKIFLEFPYDLDLESREFIPRITRN